MEDSWQTPTQLSLYRSTWLWTPQNTQLDEGGQLRKKNMSLSTILTHECVIVVFLKAVELVHSRSNKNDTWYNLMAEAVTVSKVIAILLHCFLRYGWQTDTHTRARAHTHNKTQSRLYSLKFAQKMKKRTCEGSFKCATSEREGEIWFLSLRVNSYADLFVWLPMRTHIYTHIKDSIRICRKRVGPTAGGMETRKHCSGGSKKLGSAVL